MNPVLFLWCWYYFTLNEDGCVIYTKIAPPKTLENLFKPGALNEWCYYLLIPIEFTLRASYGYFHIISEKWFSTSLLMSSLTRSLNRRMKSLFENSGCPALVNPFLLLFFVFIMLWNYHKIIFLTVIHNNFWIELFYSLSDITYIHQMRGDIQHEFLA